MKTYFLFVLTLIAINLSAQKLYKDKSLTLSDVTEKGYRYAKDLDKENVFWYKRYDKYGESMVQLTFEGNTLRKAVFVSLDPTQTLNRLKDVYAQTTDEEAYSFDPPSNGHGTGIAANTPYYSGRARFELSNNYTSRDYLFIVIPLD
jgi:hypothetical protein